MYFLQSERLEFRKWTVDDIDLALRLWGDPKVTRLIDTRPQLTREEVEERLNLEIKTELEHSVQYWPMFQLVDEEFVGCCGLRLYKPAEKILEIGAHICSEHWRKGYGLEAAKCMIKYAFDVQDAAALFAGHNPSNAASRVLLTKLGFDYTHDEFYPPTGLYHPSYLLTVEKFTSLFD